MRYAARVPAGSSQIHYVAAFSAAQAVEKLRSRLKPGEPIEVEFLSQADAMNHRARARTASRDQVRSQRRREDGARRREEAVEIAERTHSFTTTAWEG